MKDGPISPYVSNGSENQQRECEEYNSATHLLKTESLVTYLSAAHICISHTQPDMFKYFELINLSDF